MKFFKIVAAVLVLAALIGLTGCATKISSITSDVAKYENQTVTIRGDVTDRIWFDILNRGAFEVSDGSGSIWVVTNTEPPSLGSTVTVKGQVNSAFSLGDRYFGTVIVPPG